MLSFSPRALIFDMDGLLVDSEPLWHRVEREFAAARGGEFTEAMALACTGQGIGNTIRFMGERLGFPVDVERDIVEIVDRFIEHVGGLVLKPGAQEILDEVRGKTRMALASSSPRRLIDAVLARFVIRDHFEVAVSGQEVARAKPWPDVFLRTAELLGEAPAHCVVFEDSLNGARAARAANMKVIAVPEGDPTGRGFEEVADVVVRDLFEARALVKLG
ncbi:HAD family hydrolase [Polyangium aurulentum]|uniref:HAD family hydrolase n=1 Tax=Polyangium aurulentum TaxID=2567896 RepID=UPI0010AE2FC6|nr:HAD family phosphatase [Polyangium aurulentum]UQA62632.1 HAD family phosphatase [Polyangium aurulentum]